ncbi:MAG: hypothetical protein ACLVD8_06380 [Enterocloster sp.]
MFAKQPAKRQRSSNRELCDYVCNNKPRGGLKIM